MSKSTRDPILYEHELRKKMKRGKIKPFKPGVLVTGRLGSFVSPRASCEGHIWRTKKAKRSANWQSGWKQAAECLVCEDETAEIDATWWKEKATPERIQLAMRLVKEESKRLRVVYDNLKEELDAF